VITLEEERLGPPEVPTAVVEEFRYVEVEFNSAVPFLRTVAKPSSRMLTTNVLRLLRES
jgi:hypothetical protein